MSDARQQFETLRFRGPIVAEPTTVARAVHTVELTAAGPLVLAGCANGCRTAGHQVRRSRAHLAGQLLRCPVAGDGGASVSRAQRACRYVWQAGYGAPSLEARSSFTVGHQPDRSASRTAAASGRVGRRRHNYAVQRMVTHQALSSWRGRATADRGR